MLKEGKLDASLDTKFQIIFVTIRLKNHTAETLTNAEFGQKQELQDLSKKQLF